MRRAAAFLLLGALFAGSWPASASQFTVNETRAAALRDELRAIRAAFKPGGDTRRRLAARVVEAFRGEEDWGKASEAYDLAGNALADRAAALERRLDGAMAKNTPENSEKVMLDCDAVFEAGRTLRSDFEFYVRLPGFRGEKEQAAARATMRLLTQTGSYLMALSYFDSRLPGRPPFLPLPPGLLPSASRPVR